MKRYRYLALAWTLLILVGCSLPGSELPEMSLVSIDKLVHVVLFAGFGWLWMKAMAHRPRTRAWWVLTSGIAFAILTEVYQGLLPLGRMADPYDAAANITGLLLGVLIARFRDRPEPTM